eukprot:7028761-Karenia_brevis.AAC.1
MDNTSKECKSCRLKWIENINLQKKVLADAMERSAQGFRNHVAAPAEPPTADERSSSTHPDRRAKPEPSQRRHLQRILSGS